MSIINRILATTSIGQRSEHENLAMFPIAFRGSRGPAYLTLGEALEGGFARVSEVSAAGRVPELRLENSAELPVLIVDGEELVGAKQNRVANLTILAPPKQVTTIPVSCVEAGRWHADRPDFAASDRVHFSKGRAARAGSVSESMLEQEGPRSDQGRVWRDIEAKAARMGASSPTQAMSAIFDRHRQCVDDFVGAFTASEHESGAVFAIAGRVVGLDLFDEPSTFRAMLPKLVRSYALDAIDSPRRNRGSCTRTSCEDFLGHLRHAQERCYPAVGLGTDLRLTGQGIVAGALVVDEGLVHLAAFSNDETVNAGSDRRGPHMARARSRRRRYEEM